MIESVLARDEKAVASGFQRAHDEGCSPLHYNNEQALRSVVKAALIACADEWACVDELPSGHGYADMAYLPRRGSTRPASLVELKADEPAEVALDQMLNRDYPQVMRSLDVPVLLVAVTYDSKSKQHTCRIVEYHHNAAPMKRGDLSAFSSPFGFPAPCVALVAGAAPDHAGGCLGWANESEWLLRQSTAVVRPYEKMEVCLLGRKPKPTPAPTIPPMMWLK